MTPYIGAELDLSELVCLDCACHVPDRVTNRFTSFWNRTQCQACGREWRQDHVAWLQSMSTILVMDMSIREHGL